MATFRKGLAEAQRAAERTGGGAFTPRMKWKGGETKYIQFITPADEFVTVKYHDFVIVGHNNETGKPKYASFISRRDDGLDGQAGYDEIIDRFNQFPKDRTIALAVELEPEMKTVGKKNVINPDGWKVAQRQFERDGETVTVPAVMLVIESPGNFYGGLALYDEMGKSPEDMILAVKRTGSSTDTRYDFLEVSEARDWTDDLSTFFEEFDFDGYLDDLASEERMHKLIGPLPDGFVINQYAKKDKKAPQASRTTATREEAEPDETEVGDESAEEAPAATRQRRFSNLRQDMTEK